MRIASRTIFTFGISLILLLMVGIAGIYSSQKIENLLEEISDNTVPSLLTLGEAKVDLLMVRTSILSHILTDDAGKKAGFEQKLKEANDSLDKHLADYKSTLLSNAEDASYLERDIQTLNDYRSILFQVLAASKAGDTAKAKEMAGNVAPPKIKAVQDALTAHIDFNAKLAQTTKAMAIKDANFTIYMIIIGVIVALALTLFFAWRLYSIITQGLNTLQSTVSHVSQSLDFTLRAKSDSNDEVGDTVNALNRLLERMQQNLREILDGARSVASNARQMKETADQVSTSTNTQSEASANVAATVEQMTVSINHVSEQAESSYKLAENAGTLAQQGSRTISSTVSDIKQIAITVTDTAGTIRALEQQSNQISNVVSVIKEVAEQTNLLALNAAIEAARAGEQGRGFAVVADEVRKLAERTAASTQEISSTITSMRGHSQSAADQMEATVEIVNSSVTRADTADAAIQEIGVSATQTAGTVEDIATAIRQQSVASNNIAVQIERIAQMTEEASAAAQETAATASTLDELATRQISILQQYRL